MFICDFVAKCRTKSDHHFCRKTNCIFSRRPPLYGAPMVSKPRHSIQSRETLHLSTRFKIMQARCGGNDPGSLDHIGPHLRSLFPLPFCGFRGFRWVWSTALAYYYLRTMELANLRTHGLRLLAIFSDIAVEAKRYKYARPLRAGARICHRSNFKLFIRNKLCLGIMFLSNNIFAFDIFSY